MITAFKSDTGLIRTVNEDRTIVQEQLNGFTLAVVADGMGGHQAGDIASQVAIETIQQELQSVHAELDEEACIRRLTDAVLNANRKVFELASREKQYMGMGTTVVVALVTAELFYIAHIGDSRAYKWDGRTVRQLTDDHSLVNELVKFGQISAEEADTHPHKNVLTRALGTEETVEVDVQRQAWSAGEMLMLCSDGLSNLIDSESLKSILQSAESPARKVDRLVSTALSAGGDDNITVVLLANEPAGRLADQEGEE